MIQRPFQFLRRRRDRLPQAHYSGKTAKRGAVARTEGAPKKLARVIGLNAQTRFHAETDVEQERDRQILIRLTREMCDWLRPSVFQDCEIILGKIGDVRTGSIPNGTKQVDQLRVHANNGGSRRLIPGRARRSERQSGTSAKNSECSMDSGESQDIPHFQQNRALSQAVGVRNRTGRRRG